MLLRLSSMCPSWGPVCWPQHMEHGMLSKRWELVVEILAAWLLLRVTKGASALPKWQDPRGAPTCRSSTRTSLLNILPRATYCHSTDVTVLPFNRHAKEQSLDVASQPIMNTGGFSSIS
jgi:hypothetical protein